jgi:hypothetical protein
MEKFCVKIPCKSYARRWIELTFGDPAELSKNKILYNFFLSKLQKKSFRYDQLRYDAFAKYRDQINIKLSKDLFYRYGWELSRTDIVAFNMIIEKMTKAFMYKRVGIYHAIGHSLSASIEHFQETYEFTEGIWHKESIYRDCQRNLKAESKEIDEWISLIVKKMAGNEHYS